MRLKVRNQEVFASTGGQSFDASKPTLLFIHGSGQSHLGYLLQARFLANRGYAVLNPDMPAHGHSQGAPLTSIPDMADWYVETAQAAGVTQACLIGHSQGGLIALEIARRHPDFVQKIVFIATALAIPVNDMLLGLAENKEPAAIAAMTDWGHGANAHHHDHTMPGMTHLYFGHQLMAANERGALHADLKACADYVDGPKAAATLTVPALAILAHQDKMTPIKAGRALAAATNAQTIEIPHSGHMMPSEVPEDVNAALKTFLGA
ncbi:MAG: alpha/beta hydrolase [Pseudomonadota bacterium]